MMEITHKPTDYLCCDICNKESTEYRIESELTVIDLCINCLNKLHVKLDELIKGVKQS